LKKYSKPPCNGFQGLEKIPMIFPMSGKAVAVRPAVFPIIGKFMSQKYRYLFGPVPSRRFGRSLGIDVTPFKTCSFDCLFCQCGRTTRLMKERAEFVPLKEVCAELERWLAEDGAGRCHYLRGLGRADAI
jgi:hypothetical protein